MAVRNTLPLFSRNISNTFLILPGRSSTNDGPHNCTTSYPANRGRRVVINLAYNSNPPNFPGFRLMSMSRDVFIQREP